MRKSLPLIVFAIVCVGLVNVTKIRAQRPANSASQADDSNAKPCIVVFGAVRSPARFELRRRVRLTELLALSGGVTERVGQTIQIIHSGSECDRGGAEKPATTSPTSDSAKLVVLNLAALVGGDEKANPYLEAGDIVIVTELDPIYVTGSVVNPRAIYSKGPLTLTQAIKMAGGLLPKSETRKLLIYRKEQGVIGATAITVDLKAIEKHRVEDLILEPFDIVNVQSKLRQGNGCDFCPTSPPKAPLPLRVIQ